MRSVLFSLQKLRFYHDVAAVPSLRTAVQRPFAGFLGYHDLFQPTRSVQVQRVLSLCLNRRAYNPARHIDWVGIKRRWRAKQLLMKKRKLKNHPRVALRFRLTRFGWERLQQGRRGKKLHLSVQQRRNKKRIRFVSRHDLVKLARQMPGHRLRIRDPPLINSPNIQHFRRSTNKYFA
ncbi:hypothetical protein, conserved [Babesia bigemina]|uniref:Uncharacterized protein n=1 Tax=Babesia bigemina TaxID=5866 RepID=A0A061D6R5_BABBI|nr:hypothetical protein, conserved [Babesia bigemina]CDR96238.1 hypothetical protein, conserved [Babesia bigemina]|eukprot:XP_012768424.1 hypothetical protein, conserved [Babesia bigemina]